MGSGSTLHGAFEHTEEGELHPNNRSKEELGLITMFLLLRTALFFLMSDLT